MQLTTRTVKITFSFGEDIRDEWECAQIFLESTMNLESVHKVKVQVGEVKLTHKNLTTDFWLERCMRTDLEINEE
jgi:hypothetical protein